MICRDCGHDFCPAPNKPGYINQCWDCATDVELYLAEQGTEDSGIVETMTKKIIPHVKIEDVVIDSSHNIE